MGICYFNGEKSHTIYINEEGIFYPVDRSNIDVEQIYERLPNSLNQVTVGDFNGDGSTDLTSTIVYHSPNMWDHMDIITLLNTEVL